jgi:hypothetical protein
VIKADGKELPMVGKGIAWKFVSHGHSVGANLVREDPFPENQVMTDVERARLWHAFKTHPRPKCKTPTCHTTLSAYSRDDGLCSACAEKALSDAIEMDDDLVQEQRRLGTTDAAIQWKYDFTVDRYGIVNKWKMRERCKRYHAAYVQIMIAMTILPDVFTMPGICHETGLNQKTIAMLLELAERFGVVERLEERLYGRHIQWRRKDLE